MLSSHRCWLGDFHKNYCLQFIENQPFIVPQRLDLNVEIALFAEFTDHS